MAPENNLPNIDLGAIQQQDIIQSYMMLFQYMLEDFVHREDLKLILAANEVTTGVNTDVVGTSATGGPVTAKGVGAGNGITRFTQFDNKIARAKNQQYQSLIKSGAMAREGTIKGLNTITGSSL